MSPHRAALGGPAGVLTTAASVLLISVSLLVLAGWVLDIHALKGLSGDITMKANAALGLLASGLSLALLRFRTPAAVMIGRTAAAVAGGVGALTFSQHVFGWNLGIDELLFSESAGAAATASPGRMGPNGSLSLALGGTALWSLYQGTGSAVLRAQLLAAGMAVLALVPSVGYLYGAAELYAVARYTGIAVHTSIALFGLSVGLMAARSDAGPVAALTTAAPHGVMARRLLLVAMLVPLALGYLRVMGERRGLYDTGFGAAVFVVAMIVLLSITIWRTAIALERSDRSRRSAEAARDETEQRFRQIADQAPLLIWVESEGQRVWFNRRWYEFTGGDPGSTDWEGLVHPDDLESYRTAVGAAAASGASSSRQYRLRRADGEFAWVLETASPRGLGMAGGGYVGSCVDVTALRQAQQDEREARERAERADRAKDQFIAALSHELRTPLNAILGWMHLLQKDVVSNDGRTRAAEAVGRNARLLARLIEDLLDTSRIATGHLALTMAPVDVREVVHSAVETVLPAAEERQIRLTVHDAPVLPAVVGDAHRLQQVVSNLLSNALKFGRPGGRVDIRLRRDDGMIVIAVQDDGDGIDPAFLPHVFERFRQHGVAVRYASGLGLGLFIAQHLVEQHGGTLDAASEGPGKGAEFTIRLPAVADARAALGGSLEEAAS